MTTVKTWLASVALVGGAGGGAAAGLAATGGATQTLAATPPSTATPDARDLQQQIDSLLAEDRALKAAIRRAGLRLTAEIRAGEQSLAALRQRIVAAQNELARAQAARHGATPATSSSTTAPTATAPQVHATTGASGTSGTAGGDDVHESGDDG